MQRIVLSLVSVLFVCYSSSPLSTAKAETPSSFIQQREQLRKQREQLKEEREIRRASKGAKRISVYNAYQIYKSGKALLISVDYPGTYKHRRILGSINIPIDAIKYGKRNLKIPKNVPVLLYCR